MFRYYYTKKLSTFADPFRSARWKGGLGSRHATGGGKATVEQLWCTEGARGLSAKNPKQVAVQAEKDFFLPPLTWKRLYLPFKVALEGGTSVTLALQKPGVVAGLSLTKGGQLRVNIFNTTKEIIYLTPKTAMANIHADHLEIRYLGKHPKVLNMEVERIVDFGEKLRVEIEQRYPNVGDFSTHPINEKLAKLGVHSTEVKWNKLPDQGVRTQYQGESVADRRMVHDQLQDYVRCGYLEEVSVGEDVYFNILLPVRKTNGIFRCTNDFRRLNTYFSIDGETSQVDVWRKMWELKPEWSYYMEIDLKDGFFRILVDETLSKLFGFAYVVKRYRWNRLPQEWKWSMVLFHERVAEIVSDLPCLQYADNVLTGSTSLEELRSIALQVFQRFDEYGIKINFEKVEWVSTTIQFLGYEISNGQ